LQLGISGSAAVAEVRTAYKKKSLLSHPDRVQGNAAEKQRATEEFQKVADAFYVLSDPGRRASYDSLRATRKETAGSTSGASSSNYFRSFFGNNNEEEDVRPDPEETFGDVFEDMLRPEVQKKVPVCGGPSFEHAFPR
jgi:DnaJ-class molecular chaperone